jgi:hypothetical protein
VTGSNHGGAMYFLVAMGGVALGSSATPFTATPPGVLPRGVAVGSPATPMGTHGTPIEYVVLPWLGLNCLVLYLASTRVLQ